MRGKTSLLNIQRSGFESPPESPLLTSRVVYCDTQNLSFPRGKQERSHHILLGFLLQLALMW